MAAAKTPPYTDLSSSLLEPDVLYKIVYWLWIGTHWTGLSNLVLTISVTQYNFLRHNFIVHSFLLHENTANKIVNRPTDDIAYGIGRHIDTADCGS